MNREILRLAVPNIITTLTVPLLGFADMALMGHLDSPAYINAIGIGTAMFNMIYWGFGFLRMGTTGLTAQAFGNDNVVQQGNTLYRALLVAGVIALSLLLLQWPILKLSLSFFDATEESKRLAAEYFNIRIWAAPAALALYALNGWFLGLQRSTYVMTIAIVLNLTNVGLNFLFVLGLDMDVQGIALATVIAQYTGLLLALGFVLFKLRDSLSTFQMKVVTEVQAFTEFFKVNADIFFRTICLVFTFTFFTARSGSFGPQEMAVDQLLLQLMHLLSYGIDGFATAAESLVGKYFGARNKEGYKKAIRYSFYWGMGLGAGYSVVYYFWGNSIIALLTDIDSVRQAAKPYMWWLIAMPLVNAVAFIWDGVYIGRTATKAMRNNMLLATFFIFLPAFLLAQGTIGNHALWLAMLLFMAARAIGLSLYAPKAIYNWKAGT